MKLEFRVWTEFEFDGKIEKHMEETCSWFLLTQTGQIMFHCPCRAPQNPNKAFRKLIPLFYTGLEDKNGKKIYEGDIVLVTPIGWKSKKHECESCKQYKIEVKYIFDRKEIRCQPFFHSYKEVEIIGNVFSNPELLKEAK